MRRIGRLGLVGLMGVEEGEDRPFGLDELAGQAVGLGHHFADLRVGLARRQIAGTDRAKAVHLMDDHEPDSATLEAVGSQLDRQLRLQAGEKGGSFGHRAAPGLDLWPGG